MHVDKYLVSLDIEVWMALRKLPSDCFGANGVEIGMGQDVFLQSSCQCESFEWCDMEYQTMSGSRDLTSKSAILPECERRRE